MAENLIRYEGNLVGRGEKLRDFLPKPSKSKKGKEVHGTMASASRGGGREKTVGQKGGGPVIF